MQKLNTYLFSLLVVLLCFMSTNSAVQAQWGNWKKAVKGNGNVVVKERSVDHFHAIKVEGSLDVFVHQGETEGIKVEADENLHEYISTEVKGKKLVVTTTRSIKKAEKLVVYVTATELEAISLAGSGDIVGETPFKSKKFASTLAGSGDITLEVEANDLSVTLAGSGDVSIKGKANAIAAKVAGSGDINAAKLCAQNGSVSISGSGDVSVHIEEALSVSIAGSGDVRYVGNPTVSTSVIGSGTVRKK